MCVFVIYGDRTRQDIYMDIFPLFFPDVFVIYADLTRQDIYMEILPLYFPRCADEEAEAIKRLPEDIGNEDGEPIIPERQIRILDKPTINSFSMFNKGFI